mmetsp:Transcript_37895/g.55848  ORF Transcript_37895/g.55848 Transcript_37895/m.55848 type:complete len:115 (-) Transcript_37895:22-366(-)
MRVCMSGQVSLLDATGCDLIGMVAQIVLVSCHVVIWFCFQILIDSERSVRRPRRSLETARGCGLESLPHYWTEDAAWLQPELETTTSATTMPHAWAQRSTCSRADEREDDQPCR